MPYSEYSQALFLEYNKIKPPYFIQEQFFETILINVIFESMIKLKTPPALAKESSIVIF